MPAAQAYGLGLLPYLPARERPAHRQVQARRGGAGRHALRAGAAAARPLRHATQLEIVEKLEAFATRAATRMLELAFSWLAARPQSRA